MDKSTLLMDYQVAALLGVSLAAVRYWRVAGGGPPWHRDGHRVRYEGQKVEEFRRWRESRGQRKAADLPVRAA